MSEQRLCVLPFRIAFDWPTPINLIHDSLCPSDRIGYGTDRGRNLCLTAIRSKLPCSQNAGGTQQNALASLIHEGSLAVSLFCLPHPEPELARRKRRLE